MKGWAIILSFIYLLLELLNERSFYLVVKPEKLDDMDHVPQERLRHYNSHLDLMGQLVCQVTIYRL